ncbi:hypothetical protein B0H11DRAFT_2323838 [Mycena galericulata]|nr:hypothetical protein B0H11DRAFT_2323838 [Mycena galericulata]
MAGSIWWSALAAGLSFWLRGVRIFYICGLDFQLGGEGPGEPVADTGSQWSTMVFRGIWIPMAFIGQGKAAPRRPRLVQVERVLALDKINVEYGQRRPQKIYCSSKPWWRLLAASGILGCVGRSIDKDLVPRAQAYIGNTKTWEKSAEHPVGGCKAAPRQCSLHLDVWIHNSSRKRWEEGEVQLLIRVPNLSNMDGREPGKHHPKKVEVACYERLQPDPQMHANTQARKSDTRGGSELDAWTGKGAREGPERIAGWIYPQRMARKDMSRGSPAVSPIKIDPHCFHLLL